MRSAAGMASAVTCAASGTSGATLEFRAARGGGAYAVCGAREARALGWTPTTVSRDWERALTRVREAATTTREAFAAAFVGPKGVGKSTLARHAANVILRERGVCGWLDLDCGQPELTAPGMVSLTILRAPLLGPPQTHQASGAEVRGRSERAAVRELRRRREPAGRSQTRTSKGRSRASTRGRRWVKTNRRSW